ncbi:DUF1559 family PulG-like putative transporter [Adhaeretor mobilis]|uniref:DUF1559 domain-containing protein n=1 Tax=Adhaeretor mobilis TaxID=1930276 RepID=A0A517MPK5_9BACT|nr:DUF1559 domain-containing protein [Adhaeretor mobilis]QDS96809.1 hypothetical protein HG15A2_00670 [Adhaeretor mobilis]
MNRRIAIFSCLFVALLTPAEAAEPGLESQGSHAAIHPFLGDDVVAMAFVDVRAVDIEAALQLSEKSGWLYPEDVKEFRQSSDHVEQVMKSLTDAGLERIYAVARMSDVQYTAPLFIIPVAEGGDPEALRKQLRDLPDMPFQWERTETENILLGALSDKQGALAHLAALSDEPPRQAVLDALTALGNDNAGVMIFGDSDTRRVVREMLPALPAPFTDIDGKLIADGLAWGGASLNLPPHLNAAVSIQANTSEARTKIEGAINRALALGNGFLLAQSKQAEDGDAFRKLADAAGRLKAVTTDNRVTLSLGDDDAEVAALVELLGKPVREARKAAYHSQRMNNFKQMALAILNYESANGMCPPRAIYSEEGKPLLSWRVAVLPYMDQQALYNQFHLDEPWNSEHNLKFAETVVPVYRDPDPSIRRELKEHFYTTYLGVAGPGTVFQGAEGVKYKEITDGTSNTALIVEVTPDRAVPWTKPADWEVDRKKPFQGVQRKDRDGFVTVFCDGAAYYYSTKDEVQRKNWPKILTIADGSVLER